MASYVSFHWDFGDGTSSSEQNPKHIYKMAGEYLAVRRRTYVITAPNGDKQEIIDEDKFIIYVYEFDLTGPSNVVYSNKCIRSAVIPQHGIGMVEWGGDNWIWPEAFEGSCNGYDKNNTTISIIIDTISGKFYRIGIEEQWLDKLNNLGYTKGFGSEIAGHFDLKELVSNQGEFQDILHNESYVYFRPFFEEDRLQDGHNPANGFRENFHVGMKMYKDGELDYDTMIENVPLKADYTFPKKIQARRILARITFNKSSFRCVGIQQRWVELDKKPAPIFNTKSETLWIREFRSADLWLSRDSTNPLLNRSSGLSLGGSYDALIPGPDQVESSAILFGATDGLSVTLNNIKVSTLSFWINDIVNDTTIFAFDNNKSIRLQFEDGQYYLIIYVDSVPEATIPLGWDGSKWAFIAIKFMSKSIRVYKDGNSLGTFMLVVDFYGGNTVIMENSIGSIFDIRRVPREITDDALDFYYKCVVRERGKVAFLPMMR